MTVSARSGRQPSTDDRPTPAALVELGLPVLAAVSELAGRRSVVLLRSDDDGRVRIRGVLESVSAVPRVRLDERDYPVVSYWLSDVGLRVARCNDRLCAGDNESIETVSSGPMRFAAHSLDVDRSGLPVIAYTNDETGHVEVIRCGDLNCRTATITSLARTNAVGVPQLVVDRFGRPAISYLDAEDRALRLIRCNDPACAGEDDLAIRLTPDGAGGSHAIELDSSGNPVIAYRDGQDLGVKLMRCRVSTCT